MKHLKIIDVISMRKVQIGVIVILLMYLLIHLLVMKAYPFADLFSFAGSMAKSEHKQQFNPFKTENMNYEPEINAEVRQVENFEHISQPSDVNVHESRAELELKPSIHLNEQFDCGNEIPIVVIKRDKKTLIWQSINQQFNFHWDHYKKVTEMKITSNYGANTTLADILKQISQIKPTNIPLTQRPIAQLTQGGFIWNNQQTTTIETNISQNQNQNENRPTGDPCHDNIDCVVVNNVSNNIPNRFNFPIYSPNSLK